MLGSAMIAGADPAGVLGKETRRVFLQRDVVTAIADHVFILFDNERSAWRSDLEDRACLTRGVSLRGYEQRKNERGVVRRVMVIDCELLSVPERVCWQMEDGAWLSIRANRRWWMFHSAVLIGEREKRVENGRVDIIDAVIEAMDDREAGVVNM